MPEAPWTRHATQTLVSTPHYGAHRDQITRPDGQQGAYDWISAPDRVRVAAIVDGGLLVCEQAHYLAGPITQLPGGICQPDEPPAAAAARELAEETGYHGGAWTELGSIYPDPALLVARTHLFVATSLQPGPAAPEPSEADLRVRHVPITDAIDAVRGGGVRCAASALLIRTVAADWDLATGRPRPASHAVQPDNSGHPPAVGCP